MNGTAMKSTEQQDRLSLTDARTDDAVKERYYIVRYVRTKS